jgi:hypothetical protein
VSPIIYCYVCKLPAGAAHEVTLPNGFKEKVCVSCKELPQTWPEHFLADSRSARTNESVTGSDEKSAGGRYAGDDRKLSL